jgi:hypothetical protein
VEVQVNVVDETQLTYVVLEVTVLVVSMRGVGLCVVAQHLSTSEAFGLVKARSPRTLGLRALSTGYLSTETFGFGVVVHAMTWISESDVAAYLTRVVLLRIQTHLVVAVIAMLPERAQRAVSRQFHRARFQGTDEGCKWMSFKEITGCLL